MANIDNLANEIVKELQRYTDDVKKEVVQAQKDVSKAAVKELKSTSPKLTGEYAAGWAIKKDGTGQVVHNKTDYQLTHLLEKGHALRGGGRSRVFEHIAPVEKKAIDEYVKRIEKAVQS